MSKPNFYIIAGCNGAGKTTASLTLFPDILESFEFVNADEIAEELRKNDPLTSDITAGRIMLTRINNLLRLKQNFAIETTLASKSVRNIIERARKIGFQITLIYYWLESHELAKERVKLRVEHGGHNIPPNIIERRYYAGLTNLFYLYIPIVDDWIMYDNTKSITTLIARGNANLNIDIENINTFVKAKIMARNEKRT